MTSGWVGEKSSSGQSRRFQLKSGNPPPKFAALGLKALRTLEVYLRLQSCRVQVQVPHCLWSPKALESELQNTQRSREAEFSVSGFSR